MAIVVLGIVAATIIPTFFDLQSEARYKAEQATVGAVRSGIQNYNMQSQLLNRQPRFPPALDSASDGAVSNINPFFTNVCMASAVYSWQKEGLVYTSPAGNIYTYDPENGIFQSGIGLIYGWSMNEGSGASIGESSYLGQVYGNAVWEEGKVGTALDFSLGADGLGGYVQVPDSYSLDLTTAGTVGAWIYADSLVSGQCAGIVHKGDEINFSDEAYSLQFWTGNKIALIVNNGPGYDVVQSSTDLVAGQWYHVVGSWDASGMKMYVNGELSGSNSTQAVAQNSSGALNIGAQLSDSYSSFYKNMGFDGKIDEVKVYDRAISADEIKAYYNSI
ncbi:MAG: LamG domain-containing protein [Candidatus Omnitrophica bacterium]|nr:LamG domain-containing protein [Candidatus Omnitrophota bacterium]